MLRVQDQTSPTESLKRYAIVAFLLQSVTFKRRGAQRTWTALSPSPSSQDAAPKQDVRHWFPSQEVRKFNGTESSQSFSLAEETRVHCSQLIIWCSSAGEAGRPL